MTIRPDSATFAPSRAFGGCTGRRKSAFTLIELLVAVTVLSIITLLLARIIAQSNNVISEGAKQASQNASARMALNMMAMDYLQAAADGRLRFQRDDNPGGEAVPRTYGSTFPCHSLRFVSFRNVQEPADANQKREAVRLAYFVRDTLSTIGCYSLVRAEKPIEPTEPYTGITYTPTSDECAELIRYVVEFRAECYDTNSFSRTSSAGNLTNLPAYVDIYLSVLSEVEAKRANTMAPGSTEQIEYISRSAKRYHTRCWSLNGTAYIKGR